MAANMFSLALYNENVLTILLLCSEDADTVKRLFGIDLVSRSAEFLVLFSTSNFWLFMFSNFAEIFCTGI